MQTLFLWDGGRVDFSRYQPEPSILIYQITSPLYAILSPVIRICKCYPVSQGFKSIFKFEPQSIFLSTVRAFRKEEKKNTRLPGQIAKYASAWHLNVPK